MRLRSTTAWAALGLVLALTSCSSDGEQPAAGPSRAAPAPATSEAPSSTTTEAPHRDHELSVSADLVRDATGAAAASAPELVLEPTGGAALLVFPLLPTPPQCLADLSLEVHGVGVGLPPITAWVSLETEAGALPDGQFLGGVIANGSPSTVGVADADGATWDVTHLYWWARTNQPTSSTFVLALTPHLSGRDPVELGAVESGTPAVLRWDQMDGCR